MAQSTEACVVMTTYSDPVVGKKIIDTLISSKLAACIQVLSVDSHYFWKGEVQNEPEKLILIKTRLDMFDRVEKSIKENHSYETPEIICTKIVAGSSEYLSWINEMCSE